MSTNKQTSPETHTWQISGGRWWWFLQSGQSCSLAHWKCGRYVQYTWHPKLMLRGVCGLPKRSKWKRNITHHFSLLCISWTRFKDKSGPKVEEKIGRNWPVESVNEPQSDGAQICGIGDHGAVAGILDQVHGTRERSCNLCGTNTERTSVRIRQMWANDNDDNMSVNMKERIRGWNQTNWKTKNIHLCIHTDSDELIDASDESFTLLIPTPLTPLAWQRLVHQLPHLLCGHRYTTSFCVRLWGCTTKTNPFNTPWHLLTKLCEMYSITKPQ